MKSLLKFITCGSVDDGKSTLIGHLLYDAKLLFADQEQALMLDSKVGSREGAIDYSLLLDGLMAEREQGITIDVAYRYFTTDNRSFIVADTPGHEEYTRNMAVGASFADLAIILIDVTNGVCTQTRRHARICNLMGIEHVVFAINKMDLVNYDESRYLEILADIKRLIKEIPYKTTKVIPVSATEGDNITVKSDNIDWYEGESLLNYLENINVEKEQSEEFFTMPVQRVCRPNHTFRGFQGQIASGTLKVGDEITSLPSNEKAKVTGIIQAGKDVNESSTGQAVTITLDKEVDVSRGCVLTTDDTVKVGNLFTGRILWMDDTELVAGKSYYLKLGTRMIPATVMNIKHKIDINTGALLPSDTVVKNELADCDIAVSDKIVYKKFADLAELGSFILIDRVTNMTSACGTVSHSLRRSDNVVWQNLDITRDFRANQKSQRPSTIWFTGLSGSGKSTVANALEKQLAVLGKHTMLLDGDNVRFGLNKNLGFTEKDRIENIRRVAEVAKLMNDAGLIVLVSFISPYKRDREMAREIIGNDNFYEVYVNTPIEVCEARDIKGLYKKARAGEIPNFTGITAPYEAPTNANIALNTDEKSVEDCVSAIMNELEL